VDLGYEWTEESVVLEEVPQTSGSTGEEKGASYSSPFSWKVHPKAMSSHTA
jgi:hypothetical protein